METAVRVFNTHQYEVFLNYNRRQTSMPFEREVNCQLYLKYINFLTIRDALNDEIWNTTDAPSSSVLC